MEDTEKVKQRFLKDVANHVMDVKKDYGLYRHIKFQKRGCWAYHFDIVAWPGHLCICGDMGTYVFDRIPDMFEFFRSDNPGDRLEINTYYWTQKVTCVDRNSPLYEFSVEKFEANIRRHAEECGWPEDAVFGAIEQCVSVARDEGEGSACRAIQDFEWSSGETRRIYRFDDFWEYNNKVLSEHFMWCCFAVAWGIKKYDEWKEAR